MAYDPVHNQMVLFGGETIVNGSYGVSNQTWTWANGQWTRLLPSTSPPGREGAGMAWDPALNSGQGAIVMFGGDTGGSSGTSYFNDLWMWNGSTWSALPNASGPSARSAFGFAWDPALSGMIVFGGGNASSSFNDTWQYSANAWHRLQINGAPGAPLARSGLGMAYSSSTNQLVMFGGFDSTGLFDSDTWIFGGSSWTKQTPSASPSSRADHVMVYDPGMGAIIVTGGSNGTGWPYDTWAWNGSTWVSAFDGINSMSYFRSSAAAADNSGHLIVDYGKSFDSSAQTWMYDSSVPILGIALGTDSNGKGGPTGPNGIYYTGDSAVASITAANPGAQAINNFSLTSTLSNGVLAAGSKLLWGASSSLASLVGCPASGACGSVVGLNPSFGNLSLAANATSVAQFAMTVVGNTRGCSKINIPAIASNLPGFTPTVSTPLTVCGGGLGVEKWWTYDTTPLGVGGVAKVNAANGNLVVKQSDSTPVQSHGQLAFDLGRAYNSQDNMNTPGPLGAGWQWDLSATGDAASPGLDVGGLIVPTVESLLQPLSVTYVDRDGTRDVFRMRSVTVSSSALNVSTALPYLTPASLVLGNNLPALQYTGNANNAQLCIDASYQAPPGVDMYLWRYAQVNITGACSGAAPGSGAATLGWAVVRPNRERYDYDVQGRLVDVVDASGNELIYTYSGANLHAITSNRCNNGTPTYAPNQNKCPQITIAAPVPITVAGASYNKIDVTDTAGRVTTYIVAQPSSSTPLAELTQVWNPDNPFTTPSGASAFVGSPSISYAYSSSANPLCNGASTSGVITIGALCSVTDAAGGMTTFGYTKAPLGPDRILSIIDRRANPANRQASTTGSETLYSYANASDGWSTSQVTADTAAPATVGAPSGASAPTGCNNNVNCERNNYAGIDSAGRVGEVDQGDATNGWWHQEAFFWDGNPNGGINSCEQPDGAIDNNLCETITRAKPSPTAFTVNGIGTSTSPQGVVLADQGVSYVYNELGVMLSSTKPTNPAAGWAASPKDITTYGNHLQYIEANGKVNVFTDRVIGNGKVESSSDANPASYNSIVNGDGPIAYYRFDNLSGSTAADTSTAGYGQDATESPGTVLNQPGAIPGNGSVGEPGGGAWTAGVPSLTHFAGGTGTSSAFSVETWVKTSNTGIDYTVCTPCNGNGLIAGRYSGGYPWLWIQSASGQTLNILSTKPVADGAWHDVVYTYDGSGTAAGAHIYVDGVLTTSTAYNDTLGANTWRTDGAPLYVGYNSASGPDGTQLDELSLYNKVLTYPTAANPTAVNQIANHYNAVANISRVDAGTLYAISDPVQMLTPRGNAAGGNWGDYLTSYRRDVPQSYAAGTANGPYPPPNQASGNPCTAGATPQNTGLLCETDMPASAGVSAGVCLLPSTPGLGVPAGGPTDAGDSYTCTRSQYRSDGQKTKFWSAQANASSRTEPTTYYTYYDEATSCPQTGVTNCDLSGTVSAGGWLKAVTDASGSNFDTGHSVIYAYDAAGNIARTWDRNATQAVAAAQGSNGQQLSTTDLLNLQPWAQPSQEPATTKTPTSPNDFAPFTEADTAVPVTSNSLSVSTYNTEVVTPGGLVSGSGDNSSGQLGNGTTTNSGTPQTALGGVHDVVQVGQPSSGGFSASKATWALTGSGQVYYWGYGSGTPALLTGLPPLTSISVGGQHVLGLDRSGKLWAWGGSANGQVGNGSTAGYVAPVIVLTGVATFAAGGYHSLAVKTDGTVWAWGWNQFGQLGNNSTSATTTPTQVTGISNVTAVAAGEDDSYAIKADGTVWGWGDQTYGNLGNGVTSTTPATTPQQITGLGVGPGTSNSAGRVRQIVPAVWGAAALMADGTVQAWGLNNVGQLGGATTAGSQSTPVAVPGVKGLVALAGGWATYLGANEAGVTTIWGQTSSGQVGDGSSAAQVTQMGAAYNLNPASAPWRYTTEKRDQLGNRVTTINDADGDPVVVRSGRGNDVLTTSYDIYSAYDSGNNLVAVQTPAERGAGPQGGPAATVYTYDVFGNKTMVATPRGNATVMDYDSVNRQVDVKTTREAPVSSTDVCTPDANGKPQTVSGGPWPAQQQGHLLCVTSTIFDGNDLAIAQTDANSQYSLTTYDGAGEKTQQLMPRTAGAAPSLKTQWVYNPDGQVTDMCPPREFTDTGSAGACTSTAPYSTHNTIDAAGRTSAVTKYRLPSSGPAVAETTSTSYDADGNPVSVTDANGHTTTTTFDILDRKQSMSVPRGPGASNTTTWTYDPSGDVTSTTSPAGLNFGDGANGALVVDGTTAANSTDGVAHGQSNPFQVPDGARYTTVTLQNGGWVTATPPSGGGHAYGLVFYATGTVTVCSGCGITMAGQGQAGGAGATGLLGITTGKNGDVSGGNGGNGGAGVLLGNAGGGGGGGHNGPGSTGAAGAGGGGAGGVGGAASGTADFSDVGTNYINAAGGGGGGGGQGLNGSAAGNGGNGGGFIHISAPTINVNGTGTIDVSGNPGTGSNGANAGGGGGAGGGMWLTASTINLASPSVLNTSGGTGGTSSTSGAGGAGGAGAPGYLRLEADTVTNAPAGADRTRAGQTTAYSFDADHRLIDTVTGFQGTSADVAVDHASDAIPDSLGQVNERTRIGYDADGNKVIVFNPRAFTDTASLTNPKLAFSARSDYDVDGRMIATYDPRYNTADSTLTDIPSGGDGGTSIDQQSSQCPTGADPSLAIGYASYPGTVGVCVTRKTYDADGNVSRQYLPTSTGSDNRYTLTTYTDDNHPLAVTSPDPSAADGGTARVTSAAYLYDGDGRQTSVTTPGINPQYPTTTTTTSYTADGLVAETDGQSYPATNPTVKHVVQYTYDANGDQLTMTSPDKLTPAAGFTGTDYVTSTTWYSDGLKKQISAPGNGTGASGFNVTSYTYDAVGNPLSVKSPSANAGDANNTTGMVSSNTYTYDNLLKTASVPISPNNYRVTLYGYTPSGQKASTDVGTCTTGNGVALTDCAPGVKNNGGTVVWNDGGTLRYTYAPDGVNVDQIGSKLPPGMTTPTLATITTAYDQAGNPTKITGDGSTAVITGTYYLDGLLRTASDGTNANTYAYDASGMPSLRTDQTGASGFTAGTPLKTSFAYNDAGLPKAGTSSVTNASTTWTYDQGARPISRTDTTTAGTRQVVQAFNPDNTVQSLTVRANGSPTPIASDSYVYDNSGNITSDAVTEGSLSFTNAYTYNPASNLIQWTQTGGIADTLKYGWDHDSNRISVQDVGAATTSSASYNADNSLATSNSGQSGAATINSTYTGAGELTQTAVGLTVCTTTLYDTFNRTSSQTQFANSACGTAGQQKSGTKYTYDGLDRTQAVTTTPSSSGSTQYTTQSSYDGFSSQLVGQTGAATSATTNQGTTVATAYQLDANGAPVAISQTPSGGGAATVSWLNKNAQGSVTSMSSLAGAVNCTVNNDPFGNPRADSPAPAQLPAAPNGNGVCTQSFTVGSPSTGNTVWFNSQPRDPSYGTYQLGTRTYNPATASFSTPDTNRVASSPQDISVGTDPLTANTYTYVNGNPINYNDPDGHMLECVADGTCKQDFYVSADGHLHSKVVDRPVQANQAPPVYNVVVSTDENGHKHILLVKNPLAVPANQVWDSSNELMGTYCSNKTYLDFNGSSINLAGCANTGTTAQVQDLETMSRELGKSAAGARILDALAKGIAPAASIALYHQLLLEQVAKATQDASAASQLSHTAKALKYFGNLLEWADYGIYGYQNFSDPGLTTSEKVYNTVGYTGTEATVSAVIGGSFVCNAGFLLCAGGLTLGTWLGGKAFQSWFAIQPQQSDPYARPDAPCKPILMLQNSITGDIETDLKCQ